MFLWRLNIEIIQKVICLGLSSTSFSFLSFLLLSIMFSNLESENQQILLFIVWKNNSLSFLDVYEFLWKSHSYLSFSRCHWFNIFIRNFLRCNFVFIHIADVPSCLYNCLHSCICFMFLFKFLIFKPLANKLVLHLLLNNLVIFFL